MSTFQMTRIMFDKSHFVLARLYYSGEHVTWFPILFCGFVWFSSEKGSKHSWPAIGTLVY